MPRQARPPLPVSPSVPLPLALAAMRAAMLPAVLLSGLLSEHPASAAEWTRFRGPGGTGIGSAKDLPATWTEKDLLWKAELPGAGHAHPVVWGDRLFVTCAPDDGSSRTLVCLEAGTGAELWKRSAASRASGIHRFNSFASSTPTVDAERVYVVYGHAGQVMVGAWSHDGQPAWTRALGGFVAQHGFASSPVLVGELLVWQNDQGREGTSSVVAIDSRSGEVRWRTPRQTGRAAYGTPCVHRPDGKSARILLTSHNHGISCLDAATGRQLWEAKVFDKRTVSSPVVADGLVLGTCGSGGGGNYVAAVRPGGSGDVTETHAAWTLRQAAPYVPTPLAHGGKVWLWSDRGIVTCIRAKGPETVWKARVGGNYFGSPIWADGKVWCISDRGEVVVLDDGDEHRLLGRTALGEPSRSTPVVAGGRMYLRTLRHVVAIGPRGAKAR